MKRVLAILGLLVVTMSPSAALAAPECGVHDRTFTDWGKTEPGFEAELRVGCHTVIWTGTTTDMAGDSGGKFRSYKSVGNVDPWKSDYNLPGPQGGNSCEYRAAHEGNGYVTNMLQFPPGTDFEVKYRCW